MKIRITKSLGIAAITLALLAAVCIPTSKDRAVRNAGKGLSIVTMSPDAARAIKFSGKSPHTLFPNSLNQGRKFNPGGMNIGALDTAADQKVLVLFMQFNDEPPGGPLTRLDLGYFDDMLFGTAYDPPEYAPYGPHPTDRTLLNYFREVSYGKVDVVTVNLPSALGWRNSGKDYSDYCRPDGVHNYGFGPYPNNAVGLVIDAIASVDADVDFSQYAVDGVVPNLFVVHAGTGAEWNIDPSILWSHSWSLSSGSEGAYPGGMMVDGVKIDNYAMMPEVGGDLTGYLGRVTGPYPPTVGVYAHEYGHVLGLPDQYDYGYESSGTGIYSLMAGGSWNQYPRGGIFAGNSPSHLDAWSKCRLGFVTPVDVTDAVNASIPPAETDPAIYRMVVPYSGGKEYFLFENRQAIGFDQSLGLYGAHGLAIYHVDDTVLTRNYWRPNEAENWKEFRSEGWMRAWTGESHYGVSILQADDRWHLERSAWGYEDGGDLYPGRLGVTRFGNDTSPNSSSYYFWAGTAPKFGYSGVTVTDIMESSGLITANLMFVPWTPAGK